MHLIDFGGCCTAKILIGLGQTENAEYMPESELSVEQIKSFIGRQLNNQRVYGMAVLTVTTNNEQVNANAALLECGFEHSIWMSKGQHPETKLRLWWFPLNHKTING